MQRKLKQIRQRKPKEKATFKEVTNAIKCDTGFTEHDIALVLRSYSKYIMSNLNKRISTPIIDVGIFFPILNPPRPVVALKGGKDAPEMMTLDARWTVKLQVNEALARTLSNQTPTQLEIDYMYED